MIDFKCPGDYFSDQDYDKNIELDFISLSEKASNVILYDLANKKTVCKMNIYHLLRYRNNIVLQEEFTTKHFHTIFVTEHNSNGSYFFYKGYRRKKDNIVKFKVFAKQGYKVTGVLLNDIYLIKNPVDIYSFVMPDADCIIRILYEEVAIIPGVKMITAKWSADVCVMTSGVNMSMAWSVPVCVTLESFLSMKWSVDVCVNLILQYLDKSMAWTEDVCILADTLIQADWSEDVCVQSTGVSIYASWSTNICVQTIKPEYSAQWAVDLCTQVPAIYSAKWSVDVCVQKEEAITPATMIIRPYEAYRLLANSKSYNDIFTRVTYDSKQSIYGSVFVAGVQYSNSIFMWARAFLKYTLTNVLPAGAQIVSAVFNIYMDTPKDTAIHAGVYPVIETKEGSMLAFAPTPLLIAQNMVQGWNSYALPAEYIEFSQEMGSFKLCLKGSPEDNSGQLVFPTGPERVGRLDPAGVYAPYISVSYYTQEQIDIINNYKK